MVPILVDLGASSGVLLTASFASKEKNVCLLYYHIQPTSPVAKYLVYSEIRNLHFNFTNVSLSWVVVA